MIERPLKPRAEFIGIRTSTKLKARLIKEASSREISLSKHIEDILKRKRK